MTLGLPQIPLLCPGETLPAHLLRLLGRWTPSPGAFSPSSHTPAPPAPAARARALVGLVLVFFPLSDSICQSLSLCLCLRSRALSVPLLSVSLSPPAHLGVSLIASRPLLCLSRRGSLRVAVSTGRRPVFLIAPRPAHCLSPCRVSP